MYVRNKIWQDPILTSQNESVWENTIVFDAEAIDIQLKLMGYGWKPSGSDENLVVLNFGRYNCYYREVGTTPWIKFATVISERDDWSSSSVYRDTFITLGKKDNKKYEIKIIAADGEKFTAWGGSLEGITSGGQFWYNLQMRTDAPYSIRVNDSVSIAEQPWVGFDPTYFDLFEETSIVENAICDVIIGFDIYDTISINDIGTIVMVMQIVPFDTINKTEVVLIEVV